MRIGDQSCEGACCQRAADVLATADKVIERGCRCPVLAQSGHLNTLIQCLLSGVKTDIAVCLEDVCSYRKLVDVRDGLARVRGPYGASSLSSA